MHNWHYDDMPQSQNKSAATSPLRIAREKRGESTYTIARALGINQSQYWRVENGVRQPSPGLANKIAKYFGNAVTRDQILFPEDYATARRAS